MIPKPVDEITQADIDALVANQVREGRDIEYKAALPGNSDQEKREFLADVSAFANAGGGDILYGVPAAEGVPQPPTGVAVGTSSMDAETLRLENILQTGMAPRIPGVRIREVGTYAAGPVLLVRVPKSWCGPHMVVFLNLSRFYMRNNKGKYQLDVGEIRAAFAASDALPERLRRFRDDRIAKIVANDTPVQLRPGARIVLHVVPLSSFGMDHQLSPEAIAAKQTLLQPLGYCGHFCRYNLDGFVFFRDARGGTGFSSGYCQTFRSGRIEAVDAGILARRDRAIPPTYEHNIADATRSYLSALRALGVPPPFVVMVSFIGVAGYEMVVNERLVYSEQASPIDRDILLLPEIVIDNYDAVPEQILRPTFDALWNAAGWARSLNYDKDGRWVGNAQG